MSLVNKETRALLTTFLTEAIASAAQSLAQPPALQRLRLMDGVTFFVSDPAFEAQRQLTEKLIGSLGPIRGHRSDIDPIIWRLAADIVKKGSSSPTAAEVDTCLKEIEENANRQDTVIKPCSNASLGIRVNSVSIGPVTLWKTSKYLSILKKACPKLQFKTEGRYIDSDNFPEVKLPPYLWVINLQAATAVREEQAAWMIDQALSVARLILPTSKLGPMAPAIGKIEALPTSPPMSDHNRITIGSSGNYSAGGWTAPGAYYFEIAGKKVLHAKKYKSNILALFNPPKSTVAERMGQGLGWMARGRQSSDRSTRLLYFFTAVESLLSDSDKTSPIVQTVARHAAVLLSDNNERRSEIAKAIRDLYGLRSSLVHTGKRGVYEQDANTIQYIAEMLFSAVWERVDLGIKHQTFVETLSRASYGLKLGRLVT